MKMSIWNLKEKLTGIHSKKFLWLDDFFRIKKGNYNDAGFLRIKVLIFISHTSNINHNCVKYVIFSKHTFLNFCLFENENGFYFTPSECAEREARFPCPPREKKLSWIYKKSRRVSKLEFCSYFMFHHQNKTCLFFVNEESDFTIQF
jgi:hypothetical protein